MPIDVAAVKQRTDLLALASTDTQLRKVAGTGGGEWAGPCPFCGGRDRFRVQPALGYWWCRQCGGDRWHDAIDYVVRREDVGFVEACQRLGASASELDGDGGQRQRAERVAGTLSLRRASELRLAEDLGPTPAWQAAAWGFLARCQAVLWSPTGERARSYLHARGLRDETLRRWNIGFQPAPDLFVTAERWGLDGRLLLPRGIVIPWLAGGRLWHLKVRTSGQDRRGRYQAVRGGHPWLFGADTLGPDKAGALFEGEFDSLLAAQEVGDLVATASLGSCRKLPSARALEALSEPQLLLGVYDADAQGQAGLACLRRLLPALIPAPPPLGKDVSEFRQLGGDVRQWLKRQVEASSHRTGSPGAGP